MQRVITYYAILSKFGENRQKSRAHFQIVPCAFNLGRSLLSPQVTAVPVLHPHTPSAGHAATLPTSALSSGPNFQWNSLPQNKKGTREQGK